MAQDHTRDEHYQGLNPWWNFNVLFNDQPAVHKMAESYRTSLQHPGLYLPVPTDWLHATVLSIGPVGDYTMQEMSAVTQLLGPKLTALRLPEFVFDPWWIRGGVVLHITPDEQFTKIYDCVISALEAVVGTDRTRRTPHGIFLPHLTLAYSKTHDNELEIHQRLSENPVRPARFNVNQLALIKQYPKDGHYQWDVFKELPVGHS